MPTAARARTKWQSQIVEREAAQVSLTLADKMLADAQAGFEAMLKETSKFAAALYVTGRGETGEMLGSEEDFQAKRAAFTLESAAIALYDKAKDRLDASESGHRHAFRRATEAQDAETKAKAAFDKSLEPIAEADTALQAFLDRYRIDIPPVAYDAYRRAADAAAASSPACHLAPAALAAIGKFASQHGFGPDPLGWPSSDMFGAEPVVAVDMLAPDDTDSGVFDGLHGTDRRVGPLLLAPSSWMSVYVDGDGDGLSSPQNLYDAARGLGAQLCSAGGDLAVFADLSTALAAHAESPLQVKDLTVAARRYAVASALSMGFVPPSPTGSDPAANPVFAANPDLADGDVTAMVAYAISRVGTPYSQCLGVDVRPQDPECPEGTNRFGAGFFDCSGFVSSLYSSIGIKVPTTTYLMGADQSFMGSQISDRVDIDVMEPGDLLLMDGHVAMYAGDGMIVHSTPPAVVYERLPVWVALTTFAVLRPSLL